MTTFRKLMQDNADGVSLLSVDSSETQTQTIQEASPFAVLSSKKLNVDKESLQSKSVDDELTEDEAEYILALQASARSLAGGMERFQQSVADMQSVMDGSQNILNGYKDEASTFYNSRVSYTTYTDPDA